MKKNARAHRNDQVHIPGSSRKPTKLENVWTDAKRENRVNTEDVGSDLNLLQQNTTRFGIACSNKRDADLQQEYLL